MCHKSSLPGCGYCIRGFRIAVPLARAFRSYDVSGSLRIEPSIRLAFSNLRLIWSDFRRARLILAEPCLEVTHPSRAFANCLIFLSFSSLVIFTPPLQNNQPHPSPRSSRQGLGLASLVVENGLAGSARPPPATRHKKVLPRVPLLPQDL